MARPALTHKWRIDRTPLRRAPVGASRRVRPSAVVLSAVESDYDDFRFLNRMADNVDNAFDRRFDWRVPDGLARALRVGVVWADSGLSCQHRVGDSPEAALDTALDGRVKLERNRAALWAAETKELQRWIRQQRITNLLGSRP